ncbi:putative bifunctional diguanylate cyclase/phosphodiesterase [Actinospongicola halichondriae]|uniref:putative bifunctional diguanylate cyclase/phosphodiesterase n=1 Tax=Actinospongicola halichondriae TaxID=3236844 RepID=UPI003D428079
MQVRGRQGAWLFAIVLAAVACALAIPVASLSGVSERPQLAVLLIYAASFAGAERFSVNLETRREAHALTFSEIPLTIGLVFADPIGLLLARVIGAAAAVVVLRKMPPVKVLFNVAVFAIEAATAILLFNALLGSSSPVQPRGWLAAFAAVMASHLVSWISVTSVLAIAGAPVTIRSATSVLAVSGASVMAATAVALGASAVLWSGGESWVLLLFIGAALGYFFLSFIRIRERHQALSALHEFTTSVNFQTDTEGLVRTTLEGVARLLKGERVVALLPSESGVDRFTYEDGELRRDSPTPATGTDLTIAAELAAVHADLPARSGEIKARGSGIASRLPMLQGDGVLIVDGRLSDARSFDDEDVQLLETAAGHVATAFRNSQLVTRLREEAGFRAHQALHDDVTDLPNQRALVERLGGQLEAGGRLAMITVRVNSLREVNETLGLAMGDEMLRQVAARLRPVGRRAWCARSATDEFTLIIPGGQDEADEFSDRIVDAFKLPVLCDDVALAVIVGIGVALAPDHGSDSETLLRRASLAASRTALDGTTVTTWASDRDPYDPQRLTIAADLRDAIPAGELEVHFQPQLDIVNGLITGAEALVRWDHPRLGHLRPDQFIPAAENTGAIDALTLHVLTVAAMTGAHWRELGWDLDIAVNLSARNLTNPSFASDVEVILERTGLPAGSLTMELTESSVMTEAERALKTLHELDELGIAISIDDFGTGYSSLAHLRRLPVGEIKIDKSFVFDLTTSESDEAIVRSMIDLGHNLGLTVVVEGVETVEVRDRLHELGSDRLQGYLLSRPLPVDAFEHWISERPLRTIAGTPQDRVVRLQQRR